MIKTIFFDVDGTLLPFSHKGVPKSTVRALDRLKENGIRRVLATGRHILELEELPMQDINFDAYITMNGHIFLDENRRFLGGVPFSAEDQAQIISLFREKRIPIMLVEADRMYLNFENEAVRLSHKSIGTSVPPIEDYSGATLYQAIAYVSREEQPALQQLVPDCILNRWFESALDIIPSGGGKAAGIQKYLEEQGLSREETMAFGDAENDIDMLKFVQTGVAMGNAEPAVKACADYITADIEDDGIEKALLHFGLITDK